MKNLCVIPARKGSKRIKNKNIIDFYGKPLIYYPINNAIKSKIFSKIIVSTDSIKIADISKKYGAEIPYLRNKQLSKGSVGIYDVVKDIINYESKNGHNYDYICCILPTSPLLDHKLIIRTHKKIKKINNNYLITCVKYPTPIFKSFKIKKNRISLNYPKNINMQSQYLSEDYHDAGQLYWASNKIWNKKSKIINNGAYVHKFELNETWDINDKYDLDITKKLFR
tara:strand:- start:1981 stop:2655 length:675 start_codon:yes stop_codon:yes gene_type:complete